MNGTAITALVMFGMVTTGIESRGLKNIQEISWVPGIGKECQAVCQTPLVFASPFKTNPASYSCRINLTGGDTAPGYQTMAGQCTAVSNGKSLTSAAYDCGCLDITAISGLDNPSGSSCSNACVKSLDGTSGTSLSNGVGNICMATTEIGKTNHFGTAKDGTCSYVAGGSSAIVNSNDFSCVCSFAQATKSAG